MNTFIIHLRTFLITREFTVLSIFICFALFLLYFMFCALVAPVEGNNTLIALISLCFIHTLLKYQNTNTQNCRN